jgi:hypothetical protein
MKSRYKLLSIVFLVFTVFFFGNDLSFADHSTLGNDDDAIVIKVDSRRGSTRVRGYTKKSGTYVAPHRRTLPSKSKPRHNWSTKGNVNPYTGKPGTKNPNK